MRKPRRLSPEELLPYQWQMPRIGKAQGTRKAEDQASTSDRLLEIKEPTPPDQNVYAPLNWVELFGNFKPIEIEVGMGKGLFLLTSAMARPETNFFGIEIARKYQLYATTRFALRCLSNVKTVCADARWLFQQFIPSGSISAVHVYFPDPWWKARHKKRRVFTLNFARAVARSLVLGGKLHVASDVEEYFQTMTSILKETNAFRMIYTTTNSASLDEAGFQTNFERKARQKGTPIWTAEFERISEVSVL